MSFSGKNIFSFFSRQTQITSMYFLMFYGYAS
jgi:hypothetical protein